MTFQARLIALLCGVLVLLQAATLFGLHLAGQRALRESVDDDLKVGARVFERMLSARSRQLSETLRVLAADFAFREAVASGDQPTIVSVLANHGARVATQTALLIHLDGRVEADTLGGRFVGRPFLPALVARARDGQEASEVVMFDGHPQQFVAAPVLAPQPIALVCVGFAIDEALLVEARRLTGLEVSLWSHQAGRPATLISTLTQAQQDGLKAGIVDGGAALPSVLDSLDLAGEAYGAILEALPTGDGSQMAVILARSTVEAQRPFRRLELQIVGLSSAALAFALGAAVFFARGVSRPLQRLAEGAAKIERGDYASAVEIARDDEIGRLGTAFNQMRTAIRDREEQIRFQATHDGLTGLPNRTLFLDRLTQALASAKRRSGLVGMAMMDVDRFKEINDTLGHRLGDELLCEIGRRLQQAIRESDTVARLGGDEFAVLFETKEASLAWEVAQRIGVALEAPFALGGISVGVDASLGIALFPLHAEDAETLMRRADVAMYDAKKNHNRFSVYEPGRDEHSLRRLAILSELRQAIASDALEVYYQPKVDFGTGKAAHVEALTRWRHPVHGPMSPEEFIPLAEQSGNITALTRWVLRRAIGDCALWSGEGLELGVAVNLSVLDLHDPELPGYISGLLQERGLAAAKLVLEITENGLMKDAAHALEILTELKSRGIALSIDDFGTGYSSLAYLKRFPVDELKIDKSFVMHLGDGVEDSVIVRSTIELGHNMGLRVIAEGVESLAAWQELKRLGCDMAQGHYVSVALPLSELRVWMRDSPWAGGTRGADRPEPAGDASRAPRAGRVT